MKTRSYRCGAVVTDEEIELAIRHAGQGITLNAALQAVKQANAERGEHSVKVIVAAMREGRKATIH